mmetsp:Transcript_12834/g.24671  ORF Transcript_12834/g.24671 Transcript_12834/m.24671 type:complete len:104 (-) Transcript_12834:383-694(-)
MKRSRTAIVKGQIFLHWFIVFLVIILVVKLVGAIHNLQQDIHCPLLALPTHTFFEMEAVPLSLQHRVHDTEGEELLVTLMVWNRQENLAFCRSKTAVGWRIGA